jgi:outer membrane protein assembly factor BamA
LLRESERVLRSTGYLRDATIQAVSCEGGEAEIEVMAQDVWTLKPGLSFGRKGGKNSSSFGIEESNLFGLGTQLGLDIQSGVDRNTRKLFYRDPLLGGQRLVLSGEYASNSDGKASGLSLERPFYALDTRWAAGASLRRETRIDSAYEQGAVVGQYQARDRFARLYGGVSDGLRNGWVTRFTAGWTHDEHLAQPIVSATLNTVTAPADRRLVYPWLGVELLQDEFEATRNQDQIGKTEDVALGWHVIGQLGSARPVFGADRRATVFKLQLSKGLQPQPGHTLLFDGGANGRWEDDGLAGTVFSASARYYQRQSQRRSFYLAFATERAVNPDVDQQVLLGGDSGLRGYPLRYQSGKGRWLLTAEQRWFSEWYPWRLFNVGGAVFYDMGRAWDQDARTQIPQGLLRDLGFGLRLGNSRSAIGNVVHIDLAFPLDGDASIRRVQLLVEAKRSF